MEAKIRHFIKLLKLKKEFAKQVKENQTAINWVEPEIDPGSQRRDYNTSRRPDALSG